MTSMAPDRKTTGRIYYRAEILRTAHAAARRRMTPSRNHRYGDRWSTDAGGYAPHGFGYREAFASALRTAWRDTKSIARNEEIEAELASRPPIPADVVARVAAIRADAWYEPITTAGNARMREIYAEANAIEEAARSSVIAAQHLFQRGPIHVAC